MGFLAFLKKSRFFMQSPFRHDFRAQKLPKARKSYYLSPLLEGPFHYFFILFFGVIFQRFLEPLLSDFGPLAESQKPPKNVQNGREKSMEVLLVFWEGPRRVPGGFWSDFEPPGPPKMSFSCTRDAHFEKIMFFHGKWTWAGFWSDFNRFWDPFWDPLGP